MSVFPLNIPEKKDSPELLAFFQQFGLNRYLSAGEINKMTAALTELKEASTNVSVINTIIVNNSFTKVGQIFKGIAGTQWNIKGLNYTNPTDQEITIPLCATGKVRTDRIVLDTNNNFVLVQGVEVTVNPVAQSKPVNTLDYTFIPVNDSEVDVPISPFVGTDVVKKSFSNMFEFNGTGADAIIPLHPSGYSEIRLINAGLTSVSGVDLSLMTGTNFELPYVGKPFIFWNRTGNNISLNNGDYINTDFPLFLTEGSNLIFPHNHFVVFKWDATGLYQVQKSWVDLSDKLDKVSTVDVEKVYVKKADGTQSMKPISEFVGGNVDTSPKRSYFAEWKLGGGMSASTSWYQQDTFSGLRGGFSANASLTPSNSFANCSVQTPAFVLPFQAKIKAVTVRGFTNGTTGATIRTCVVKSDNGDFFLNPAIIGDVSYLLNSPSINSFHNQFTSTGLTFTTLPALTQIRIFNFNNNQNTPLQDTIISVEFEEVI